LGIKTYSQDAVLDTDDLPAGKCCFWVDTDDSNAVYLCYNSAGTIKKVEMT